MSVITTSSANNLVFRGFFEKQTLTGPKFINWYRQLRILLSIEDKLNYPEQPIPSAPVVPAEIQQNQETLHAHEMLLKLKTLFAQQAEQELLQTTRDFHSCKQEKGQSVSSYVLNMKGYIDNLERLGHPVTLGLGVILILISLRKEFDGFVQNYNMHSPGKTINELHAMLKLHEQTLPKNNAPALHAIRARKNKQAYAPKPKIPLPPKREDPAKDSICHECGEIRHWKRNCPQYLAELLKKKKNAALGAGGSEFFYRLKDHGIIAHRTPPYTPQHNGVSERRNRTLLDMVRSMMSQTTLPQSFWDYALETAARILNMVPTKKVEKTPYERDTLTKPDKLEPRSIKCIFIGYPKEMMGYSLYYPPENKVRVARNAEFLENSLINQEASGSLEDLEIIQEEDMHPSIDTSLNHEYDNLEIDEPQTDIVPIRRSTRTRHVPYRMCLYIDVEEHESEDLGEPANYKTALLDPESEKWLKAMNEEMQSMKDNEVWVLVELPLNGKTIGSKWLFKKKTNIDGVVHTYKARLVANGYTQTPGIDYVEKISPVADVRAIRILNEEVYMEQPEGFVNQKYSNRESKLKCSIYRLKQASRQWNKRFDDEIKKFGFTKNRDEPCVYLKASGSNITFLILYVDDILIMGNNIPMLQSVKSYIERCFAMKDLGEAAYILEIKIYRDRSRRLIGLCSIMYAVRCTRRDVAFAQNVTSQFQQNLGDLHWTCNALLRKEDVMS
nr:hypothetical protein [Tanacetum cinerariifolium]